MKIIRFFTRILARLTGFILAYLLAVRFIRQYIHTPVPAFVGQFLDSDLRRRLQPPGQIVERSGIFPGMNVLEIGCGSGAFTLFVAQIVGPKGTVDAVDIQPGMLAQMRAKLQAPAYQHVRNIQMHEANAYALPFEDNSFDVVYLITVLQEIPNPHRALVEARRVVRPGGRIAVSEFLPDPDYPLASRTVQLGLEAGLIVEAALGNLWNYTIRFRKG
jgi:ubiquinone/menaquinone biosynthesis C-methylase UbiE